MNLNAYDDVNEKINKTKTWINVRKKLLITRELSNRPYNCILKRYDAKSNSTYYFIAMLDNPPLDRQYKFTKKDDYGRIKISLASIWKETYLTNIVDDCNIMINLVEHDDDGDVYLLDV